MFSVVERGKVEIKVRPFCNCVLIIKATFKGKGESLTYWLTGKESMFRKK
jgi:hypothetical protein